MVKTQLYSFWAGLMDVDCSIRVVSLIIWFSLSVVLVSKVTNAAEPELQYESDGIAISAANAAEPRVTSFGRENILAAARYLDDGAEAWVESNSCVACHTTGVYMAERPALTPFLGQPPKHAYENFLAHTPEWAADPPNPESRTKYEDQSITAVWRTLGLAEWDRHVHGSLSQSTDISIRDMLSRLHHETGLWPTYQDIEIPYITTDFELSVHGAQAIAVAPDWLNNLSDPILIAQVEQLKAALKSYVPNNDYELALKLQLASFWPELVSIETRKIATEMLFSKQHEDGGWSTREMSPPLEWRDDVPSSVVTLLSDRPEESDPYMTAFAIILLRGEGIPSADSRIQKGLSWLKREQRISGRWWARTMLRETYHYITYIATAKALSALAACDELDLQ